MTDLGYRVTIIQRKIKCHECHSEKLSTILAAFKSRHEAIQYVEEIEDFDENTTIKITRGKPLLGNFASIRNKGMTS